MSEGRRWLPVAGYAICALLLYALFLVVTVPASWLATGIERASEGMFRVGNPQGTAWRGEGELYAGTPPATVQQLGTLHWSVNPFWLLLGEARLSLTLSGTSARGQASLQIARKNYAVHEMSLTLPAQLASLVYAPASFFQPSGTVELRSSSLALNQSGLNGQVEATWRGAGGRLSGAGGLGDYRIEIKGNGATAALQLATLSGNLQLNGQGQWRVIGDGELQFTGTAMPTGDAAALAPLLRSMGRDLGGGRHEIRFNLKLPLAKQLGI